MAQSEALIAAARRLARRKAAPTLDEIAREAGVSRATLFRQTGGREGLNRMLRKRGHGAAVVESRDTRQAAVEATRRIATRDGLKAVTMGRVAREAGVSLPGLRWHFRTRSDLFAALVEAYAPLPAVVSAVQEGRAPAETVPRILAALYDGLLPNAAVFRAIIGDALVGGEDGAQAVREYVLPQIASSLIPWVAEQQRARRLRRAHPVVVAQALVGPMIFHILTRMLLADAPPPFTLPSREELVPALSEAFLRGWSTGRR